MTHMGSSAGTAVAEPAKQGQQGTQMFPCRQRSGADFFQLTFSDTADPSAKTTADLWPSLSLSHTQQKLCPPPGDRAAFLICQGRPTRAAASGSWQQGPAPRSLTPLVKDKQSQPISARGCPAHPRPLPSHFSTCMRGTRTHRLDVTLWCP